MKTKVKLSFIVSWPKKCYEENCCDRGTKKVGDSLDVVEQLGLLVAEDDGNPGDADDEEDDNEHPTDDE